MMGKIQLEFGFDDHHVVDVEPSTSAFDMEILNEEEPSLHSVEPQVNEPDSLMLFDSIDDESVDEDSDVLIIRPISNTGNFDFDFKRLFGFVEARTPDVYFAPPYIEYIQMLGPFIDEHGKANIDCAR